MYLHVADAHLRSLEVKKPAILISFPEIYLRNSFFHLIQHIHKLVFKQTKSE